MTSRGALRDLTADVLLGVTDARDEIYTPSDWPTWSGTDYPVILVSAPREDKESITRNGPPQFNVTATIRVVAKAQVKAQAADFGATLAEEELERLERQVLRAVINNPLFLAPKGPLQQFAFVRSEVQVDSSGEQHVGELVLDIGMEYYAGEEDFWPDAAVPFTEVFVHADLANVFDKSGTYADPPFPASVARAPRTSGPDGRDEAAVDIILPQ